MGITQSSDIEAQAGWDLKDLFSPDYAGSLQTERSVPAIVCALKSLRWPKVDPALIPSSALVTILEARVFAQLESVKFLFKGFQAYLSDENVLTQDSFGVSQFYLCLCRWLFNNHTLAQLAAKIEAPPPRPLPVVASAVTLATAPESSVDGDWHLSYHDIAEGPFPQWLATRLKTLHPQVQFDEWTFYAADGFKELSPSCANRRQDLFVINAAAMRQTTSNLSMTMISIIEFLCASNDTWFASATISEATLPCVVRIETHKTLLAILQILMLMWSMSPHGAWRSEKGSTAQQQQTQWAAAVRKLLSDFQRNKLERRTGASALFAGAFRFKKSCSFRAAQLPAELASNYLIEVLSSDAPEGSELQTLTPNIELSPSVFTEERQTAFSRYLLNVFFLSSESLPDPMKGFMASVCCRTHSIAMASVYRNTPGPMLSACGNLQRALHPHIGMDCVTFSLRRIAGKVLLSLMNGTCLRCPDYKRELYALDLITGRFQLLDSLVLAYVCPVDSSASVPIHWSPLFIAPLLRQIVSSVVADSAPADLDTEAGGGDIITLGLPSLCTSILLSNLLTVLRDQRTVHECFSVTLDEPIVWRKGERCRLECLGELLIANLLRILEWNHNMYGSLDLAMLCVGCLHHLARVPEIAYSWMLSELLTRTLLKWVKEIVEDLGKTLTALENPEVEEMPLDWTSDEMMLRLTEARGLAELVAWNVACEKQTDLRYAVSRMKEDLLLEPLVAIAETSAPRVGEAGSIAGMGPLDRVRMLVRLKVGASVRFVGGALLPLLRGGGQIGGGVEMRGWTEKGLAFISLWNECDVPWKV